MTSSDPRGHHGLRVFIAAEGQMTYPDGPRFVVRELEGYSSTGKRETGLTVTVVDRVYCSQVLRMWRSEEEYYGGPFSRARDSVWSNIRAVAATYCAELNARVADAQAGTSLGNDHPSLSPFDSGCPR